MNKQKITPVDDAFLENFLSNMQLSKSKNITYRLEIMQEYIKTFYHLGLPEEHILKILDYVANGNKQQMMEEEILMTKNNYNYKYLLNKEFNYNDEKITLNKINKDSFIFLNPNGDTINLNNKEAQKVFNNYHNEQRQEKINKAQQMLNEGCKKFFTSENFQKYLDTMATFRHYSARNSMLILMQKPDATFVASAADWKNKHNRYVNKGERSLQILAPNIKEVNKMVDKIDPITGQVILDDKGNPVHEKTDNTQKKIVGWLTVPVFDVSQTNGEPLPTVVNILNQNLDNYNELIETIKKIAPCPVFIDNLGDRSETIRGYYSSVENEIHIRENMPQLQTVKTAIHELTHSILHNNKDLNKDKRTIEVEAESVAYVVTKNLGLDTSDYSFGYIASWSSNKEVPELLKSADTIKSASNNILTKLEKECPDLFQTVDYTVKLNNSLEKTENSICVNSSSKPIDMQLNDTTSKPIPKFSVGDTIRYDNDFWKITKIDGESAIEIKNINNPECVLPIVSNSISGNWKDVFAQEGIEVMPNNNKILVAVESTNDYADPNFHSGLADINIQNEDGTYGKIIDLYRIVKVNDNGYLEPYDKQIFTEEKAAIDFIAESDNLKLVNYDDMVNECYKVRNENILSLQNDNKNDLSIKINYHESIHINGINTNLQLDKMNLSFPLANALLAELNKLLEKNVSYSKVDYSICSEIKGQKYNYSGRYDIGSEEGSLIDTIKDYIDYELNHPEISIFSDPKSFNEHISEMTEYRDNFIPFLEANSRLSANDREKMNEILSHVCIIENHPKEGQQLNGLKDFIASAQRELDKSKNNSLNNNKSKNKENIGID